MEARGNGRDELVFPAPEGVLFPSNGILSQANVTGFLGEGFDSLRQQLGSQAASGIGP